MAAKLSPETEDEIVAMYTMGGKSGIEIQRFIGCDLSTVYRVLFRNGIEIRPPGNHGKEIDEAAVCLSYEEVRAGKVSRKHLLTMYAISDSMLRAILQKNGVRTMDEDMKDLQQRRRELVVEAYEQGWPVTKISAAFNTTLPTIYHWLALQGVQLRRVKAAQIVGMQLEELAHMLEVERNLRVQAQAAVDAEQTGGVQEGKSSE